MNHLANVIHHLSESLERRAADHAAKARAFDNAGRVGWRDVHDALALECRIIAKELRNNELDGVDWRGGGCS